MSDVRTAVYDDCPECGAQVQDVLTPLNDDFGEDAPMLQVIKPEPKRLEPCGHVVYRLALDHVGETHVRVSYPQD